ncbi:hypothetical protein CCACVL1_17886 [Corchorus capsularis]|uniref:Uncharacterized protein n=1 Tax=Corchorus capsularis TaxID=210143 RepID=A0A1R3HPC4_COCAP|nr:hypothetical protein CCACVL1_17886 [Corchorus capsularis]
MIFDDLAQELARINLQSMPACRDSTTVKLPQQAYDILNNEYEFTVGLSRQSLRRDELKFKIYDYKLIESEAANRNGQRSKQIGESPSQQPLTATIEDLALQTPLKDLSGSPTVDQDSPALKNTIKPSASIDKEGSPAKKQKQR